MVEDVLTISYWLPCNPLFPPIADLCWLYSWIDRLACFVTSGSNIFRFVPVGVEYVCMVSGELVHNHYSIWVLTLPVAFLVASSATLMQTAAVSHLILSDQVSLVNEGCLWSNKWEAFADSWNYPPEAINPIGACWPGYLSYASAEANTYLFSASTTTYLFTPYLKLLPNPSICI